eukprot:1161430-Pelagomonas_calceolata.AAC.7
MGLSTSAAASRPENSQKCRYKFKAQLFILFAVKVNGHHLPETVPQSSTAQLQHRLSRRAYSLAFQLTGCKAAAKAF